MIVFTSKSSPFFTCKIPHTSKDIQSKYKAMCYDCQISTRDQLTREFFLYSHTAESVRNVHAMAIDKYFKQKI